MSSLLEMMPGDAVANRLLQLAADFVGLISDKDGAAQRLSDLATATAAAEAKITEARQARRGADERIAEVERELAEHNDRMLADRQVLAREREAFARERATVLDEANKSPHVKEKLKDHPDQRARIHEHLARKRVRCVGFSCRPELSVMVIPTIPTILISNENYAVPVFRLCQAESHPGSFSRKVLAPGSRCHLLRQNWFNASSKRA